MKKTISLTLVLALCTSAKITKADFTFSEPINLGPAYNSPADDFLDSFSADSLEMYLDSMRSGGYGWLDIWVSRRSTTNEDWGPPENIGSTINTGNADAAACISSDGLELYFSTYNRPGDYRNWDIWITTRTTKDDPWGEPLNLGPVVNSPSLDMAQRISSDELELYFTSTRPGGYGSNDI